MNLKDHDLEKGNAFIHTDHYLEKRTIGNTFYESMRPKSGPLNIVRLPDPREELVSTIKALSLDSVMNRPNCEFYGDPWLMDKNNKFFNHCLSVDKRKLLFAPTNALTDHASMMLNNSIEGHNETLNFTNNFISKYLLGNNLSLRIHGIDNEEASKDLTSLLRKDYKMSCLSMALCDMISFHCEDKHVQEEMTVFAELEKEPSNRMKVEIGRTIMKVKCMEGSNPENDKKISYYGLAKISYDPENNFITADHYPMSVFSHAYCLPENFWENDVPVQLPKEITREILSFISPCSADSDKNCSLIDVSEEFGNGNLYLNEYGSTPMVMHANEETEMYKREKRINFDSASYLLPCFYKKLKFRLREIATKKLIEMHGIDYNIKTSKFFSQSSSFVSKSLFYKITGTESRRCCIQRAVHLKNLVMKDIYPKKYARYNCSRYKIKRSEIDTIKKLHLEEETNEIGRFTKIHYKDYRTSEDMKFLEEVMRKRGEDYHDYYKNVYTEEKVSYKEEYLKLCGEASDFGTFTLSGRNFTVEEFERHREKMKLCTSNLEKLEAKALLDCQSDSGCEPKPYRYIKLLKVDNDNFKMGALSKDSPIICRGTYLEHNGVYYKASRYIKTFFFKRQYHSRVNKKGLLENLREVIKRMHNREDNLDWQYFIDKETQFEKDQRNFIEKMREKDEAFNLELLSALTRMKPKSIEDIERYRHIMSEIEKQVDFTCNYLMEFEKYPKREDYTYPLLRLLKGKERKINKRFDFSTVSIEDYMETDPSKMKWF